jgi:hypothetical protein
VSKTCPNSSEKAGSSVDSGRLLSFAEIASHRRKPSCDAYLPFMTAPGSLPEGLVSSSRQPRCTMSSPKENGGSSRTSGEVIYRSAPPLTADTEVCQHSSL